jgi:hypothetical protein
LLQPTENGSRTDLSVDLTEKSVVPTDLSVEATDRRTGFGCSEHKPTDLVFRGGYQNLAEFHELIKKYFYERNKNQTLRSESDFLNKTEAFSTSCMWK